MNIGFLANYYRVPPSEIMNWSMSDFMQMQEYFSLIPDDDQKQDFRFAFLTSINIKAGQGMSEKTRKTITTKETSKAFNWTPVDETSEQRLLSGKTKPDNMTIPEWARFRKEAKRKEAHTKELQEKGLLT